MAETTGIPWASTMITPMGFLSAYDPPLAPRLPRTSQALRPLGPAFWGPLFRLARRGRPARGPALVIGSAGRARAAARRGKPAGRWSLALPGAGPVLRGARRPSSPTGRRRRSSPASPSTTRTARPGCPPDLARFLDDGPPPIVFTLGYSAVPVAGRFYEDSAAAARRLGRRAVLLVGKDPRNRPPSLPEGVVAFDYAPFSELFPRAAAVVHQGGIGTTALAMRAGRPMLVVPFAHDQPDNAERLARLGVARRHPRAPIHRGPRRDRVAAPARRPVLLAAGVRGRRAGRHEDGVRAACDALEAMLGGEAEALKRRSGEGFR